MFKQLCYTKRQKGLSLIETSMVLVLTAIVVVGVTVYYQTAQTNKKLEKTSAQIMHIVSEIDGLYAGKKANATGRYEGLYTNTLASAVSDLEFATLSSTEYIKTAFPDVLLAVYAAHYDPVTKDYTYAQPFNHYVIVLTEEQPKDIAKLCLKFVSLNYGHQSAAILFDDGTPSPKVIEVSAPLSDKLQQCQKMTNASHRGVGIVFK